MRHKILEGRVTWTITNGFSTSSKTIGLASADA